MTEESGMVRSVVIALPSEVWEVVNTAAALTLAEMEESEPGYMSKMEKMLRESTVDLYWLENPDGGGSTDEERERLYHYLTDARTVWFCRYLSVAVKAVFGMPLREAELALVACMNDPAFRQRVEVGVKIGRNIRDQEIVRRLEEEEGN